jgi:hypothetical protein
MKKLLVILSILALTGCGLFEKPAPEVAGNLKEVTVQSKRFEKTCMRGCWNDYYVTFAKGEQKIELVVENNSLFLALIEGSIVNVAYSNKYKVLKVTFPKLEGETP